MTELPTSPSFRLDGQRALVTGGSGGIGLAIAAALGRAGAHVTVAARREAELRNVCAALRKEQVSSDFAVLDVTRSADVEAAVADAAPYDILVNNAGMNRPAPLVEQTDQDIDAVFDLNVKAALYVSRAVARRLLAARRPGSIINVSSQMGCVGSPRRVLYCASKHAMEGMTKALAWELGAHGIRVNSICPTFIETPMTSAMFDEPGFRQWVCERIALGRVGRLDEIMGAAVFLASSASSLMTGSALMLDGGWTAA
ncbi:MAG: SDR family oxidoreductase [Achromobacter sp.]|uniref:SDR family NAD(P)-dependent oxidoreductase n=1 Tax=Achromobacter sp. TaxID=134375 RepID=UPI00258ADC05|nr:SDR family oxidoreductase [Achromobacter sp.]MCW0209350.1 SDR family oxidoreductase [Achromobacter sp.]